MKDQYIKRSEVDALIEEKVKGILANMLGFSTTAPPIFLPTREAAKELQCSKDVLLQRVKTGFYRIGKDKEVQDRRSPNSSRPAYWFNIKKCQMRDETLPEKRK